MVRVHKRASKRVGTKQKSKILRKVREHHRKSRREAKKDKTWKSKKRQDPGIPNSYPYKEELLNEIEERRRLAEEQRLLSKEAKIHPQSREEEDASDSEGQPEAENGADTEIEAKPSSTEIRRSATPTMFRGTLDDFLLSFESDAEPHIKTIILLLDARDPKSWRVPMLEKQIMNKPVNLVVSLSRADLVPLEQLTSWIAHLSNLYSQPVFPICSPAPAGNGRQGRAGGGIAALVSHVETILSKSTQGSDEDSRDAVALIGLENSGRTSLANILAPSMPQLSVFDTPFIVQANSRLANNPASYVASDEEDDEDSEESLQQRDDLAAHRILMRNSGQVWKIREPLPLVQALLRRVPHKSDLMVAYNTPAFGSHAPRQPDDDWEVWRAQKEKEENHTEEFLILIARKNGRLKKGSMPDAQLAARDVLRDWSMGNLGYYAKPPNVDKGKVDEARQAIGKDSGLSKLVLPRKEWKKQFNGKEIRLNEGWSDKGVDGLLSKERIALARVEEGSRIDEKKKILSDASDDDGEEEELKEEEGDSAIGDSEEDGESEEDVEEALEEAPSTKSILKNGLGNSDHHEAETRAPLSKKAQRLAKRGKEVSTTTTERGTKRVRF